MSHCILHVNLLSILGFTAGALIGSGVTLVILSLRKP